MMLIAGFIGRDRRLLSCTPLRPSPSHDPIASPTTDIGGRACASQRGSRAGGGFRKTAVFRSIGLGKHVNFYGECTFRDIDADIDIQQIVDQLEAARSIEGADSAD